MKQPIAGFGGISETASEGRHSVTPFGELQWFVIRPFRVSQIELAEWRSFLA